MEVSKPEFPWKAQLSCQTQIVVTVLWAPSVISPYVCTVERNLLLNEKVIHNPKMVLQRVTKGHLEVLLGSEGTLFLRSL